MEVEVNCAVYGVGLLFSVKTPLGSTVSALKCAIVNAKKGRDDRFDIDPDAVTLYFAKDEHGWLPTKNVKSFLAAGISPKYEEMNPFAKLRNADYFGPDFKPGEQIHVLVELPQPKRGPPSDAAQIASKLTTFKMALKRSSKHDKMPTEGDFLNLFEWTDEDCGTMKNIEAINAIVGFTGSQFYVRKEILYVLKNFRMVYEEEFTKGDFCDLQFILMGSPGTGKSCVLALICFYIAIILKRPVLWRRQISVGYLKSWTRLFHDGEYYEWIDQGGSMYEFFTRSCKVPQNWLGLALMDCLKLT